MKPLSTQAIRIGLLLSLPCVFSVLLLAAYHATRPDPGSVVLTVDLQRLNQRFLAEQATSQLSKDQLAANSQRYSEEIHAISRRLAHDRAAVVVNQHLVLTGGHDITPLYEQWLKHNGLLRQQ